MSRENGPVGDTTHWDTNRLMRHGFVWAGGDENGVGGNGVYLKEPFEKTDWFFQMLSKSGISIKALGQIRVLDLGCGNGTRTVPVVARISQSQEVVEHLGVDHQKGELLQYLRLAAEYGLLAKGASADLRTEKGRHFNNPNLVFAFELIHWLSTASAYSVFHALSSQLDKGGVFIGTACTPLNLANISSSDRQWQKYRNSWEAMNSRLPLERGGEGRYRKKMTFWGKQSLSYALESAGFDVLLIETFKNPVFKNGRGKYAHENIKFVAVNT